MAWFSRDAAPPTALPSPAVAAAALSLNSLLSAAAWCDRLSSASPPSTAEGHARGNDARNVAHRAATAYSRAAAASE